MADPLTLHVQLDATAATALLHAAETEAKRLGLPPPQTGTRALGPFSVTWDAHGSLREHTGQFVLKGPEYLWNPRRHAGLHTQRLFLSRPQCI